MKLKLTAVDPAVIVFNILFCVIFYASQWVPIVSLSLQPHVNYCGGLQTFAEIGFLKLFLLQAGLSVALHVVGIWLMTNSLRHFKSLGAATVLVLLPFFVALIVLKMEPFVVDCI